MRDRVYGQSGFSKYSEGVTTLRASDHKEPRNIALSFHLTQDPIHGVDFTPQLTTGAQNGGAMLGVQLPAQVRRLTPIECERLMGWPDDHTATADDGTPIADSHRYRMCGNGVAAPVAEWVAEQINRAMGES